MPPSRHAQNMLSSQTLPPLLDGGRKRIFLTLLANGCGQSLTTVGRALCVSYAFDRFLAHPQPGETQALLSMGLGLLSLALLQGWLRRREYADAERLAQDYLLVLRERLFLRLAALPGRSLQARSGGGLMLRFAGDLTALRLWIGLGVARLSVSGVTMVGALGALIFLNPVLGSTAFCALGFFAACSWGLRERLSRAIQETRRHSARVSARIYDVIGAMQTIQAFNQSAREQARYKRSGGRLGAAMVERAKTRGELRALTEVTSGLALAGIVIAGALQILHGDASVGTVAAAITITGILLDSLRDLGRVYEYFHGAKISGLKLASFLESDANPVRSLPALKIERGDIELHGLRFGNVLQDLCAHVPAGRKIAIVGPNAAGKSTLLAILGGVLQPDSGQVLFDGQDIALHRPASWRRVVGMAGGELRLLRGSLRRNLTYRQPQAKTEAVQQIIDMLGLQALIDSLPRGLATRLYENGKNLSLGQQQLIGLARALLGRPRVLLLDEIDSHLDAAHSARLDRLIREFDGTIFFVTHRPERLRLADELWHLCDGRLIETGSPDRLLEGDGPTARLFAGAFSEGERAA